MYSEIKPHNGKNGKINLVGDSRCKFSSLQQHGQSSTAIKMVKVPYHCITMCYSCTGYFNNFCDWGGVYAGLHTAKTKYRNFETNIPRKGISGTQSQFPHSCVCERFIYSHDWSAYTLLEEICRPILGLDRSLTDT